MSTTNRSNIDWITEYKYVGLWHDDKFTFKPHIDNLVSKLVASSTETEQASLWTVGRGLLRLFFCQCYGDVICS